MQGNFYNSIEQLSGVAGGGGEREDTRPGRRPWGRISIIFAVI